MGRRSNNGSWFWIIFLLIFFPSIIEGFLPLLAIVLGLWAVIALIRNSSSAKSETHRGTRFSGRSRTRYTSGDTLHSADKKARVNVYLMKRYRTTRTVELVVNGTHILLTNPNDNYRSMEQLQVSMGRKRYANMENRWNSCR